jgi:hypothetical protein
LLAAPEEQAARICAISLVRSNEEIARAIDNQSFERRSKASSSAAKPVGQNFCALAEWRGKCRAIAGTLLRTEGNRRVGHSA